MATDTVTIDQFIADHKLTMDAKRTSKNPNMDHDPKYPMDHWKVTLRMGTRRMTTTFSMGMGHHGAQPDLADVLDCLASDASSYINSRDFEDFCSEFGYDTDSRKAERTYKACGHNAKRLERFLGSESLENLMYNTERM